MKKMLFSSLLLAAALNVGAVNNMKVTVSKPGAPIQSTMYGIFFEDINYAADGGLYAELVMNRSFEFPNNFAGESSLCSSGSFRPQRQAHHD